MSDKTQPHYFIFEHERLPIVIRKRSQSRRMVIRYQPTQHALSLTLPRYVSVRQGLSFIEEKRAWVERQIARSPARIAFCDGETISVFGTPCAIRHVGGRGLVRVEENQLLVPGDTAFVSRRVREWLMKYLREYIAQLANTKAGEIGCRISRITLRDTTSRWGSCSSSGALSFSWRLVFAPREVVDYLVCHEVAHLKEMNHSKKFWNIVATLYPEYRKQEHWLDANGQQLYRYG